MDPQAIQSFIWLGFFYCVVTVGLMMAILAAANKSAKALIEMQSDVRDCLTGGQSGIFGITSLESLRDSLSEIETDIRIIRDRGRGAT